MTVTDDKAAVEKVEMVSCTIDGFEIEVPKGTLIIRAAELLGIQIPGSASIRCSNRSAPAGSAWWRSPTPGTAAGCRSRRRPAPPP